MTLHIYMHKMQTHKASSNEAPLHWTHPAVLFCVTNLCFLINIAVCTHTEVWDPFNLVKEIYEQFKILYKVKYMQNWFSSNVVKFFSSLFESSSLKFKIHINYMLNKKKHQEVEASNDIYPTALSLPPHHLPHLFLSILLFRMLLMVDSTSQNVLKNKMDVAFSGMSVRCIITEHRKVSFGELELSYPTARNHCYGLCFLWYS